MMDQLIVERDPMPRLDKQSARAFADQFRSARLAALADAEAFDEIIHVVERLGSYLRKETLGDKGRYGSLERYRDKLGDLVKEKRLAVEDHHQFKNLLTPFGTLYDLVKEARNDALHQGAFARHLTKHAIELGIILEEVLSTYMDAVVADFVVRNPVCGEPWQPIAFLRQQMLANSFSYLPVCGEGLTELLVEEDRQQSWLDKPWFVVSDRSVAAFLGPDREGEERIKRLSKTLKEVASDKRNHFLVPAEPIPATTPLQEALDLLGKSPSPILLVQNPAGTGLLGIVTPFDLL